MTQLDDFTKVTNVKAVLMSELKLCVCTEFAPTIEMIQQCLEWAASPEHRPDYRALFSTGVGVFYLIFSVLSDAQLVAHGVSIRHSRLTNRGREFLRALQTLSIQEILDGEGCADNGITYDRW